VRTCMSSSPRNPRADHDDRMWSNRYIAGLHIDWGRTVKSWASSHEGGIAEFGRSAAGASAELTFQYADSQRAVKTRVFLSLGKLKGIMGWAIRSPFHPCRHDPSASVFDVRPMLSSLPLLRRRLIGNGIALSLAALLGPTRALGQNDRIGSRDFVEAGEQPGGVVRVPFEVGPGGHLFVDVSILGRRVPAVLDSGSVSICIDSEFAAEVGLTPSSPTKAAGLTADVAVAWVALPAVSVGGRTIRDSTAMAIDLAVISGAMSRRIYLVLGQDFFRDAILSIDFAAQTLEFRPPSAPFEPGLWLQDLRVSPHGRLYTRASVEGRPPVDAMYDLENNAPVTASPAFAAASGLLLHRPVSKVASVGGEGMSISSIATLKSITVAGRVLREVPVEIPIQWNQAAPIVIGSPVWRRFENVIDLPHRRLGLKPNATGFDRPFAKDRSGIGAQRLSDRLRIVFVAPGSPAEAAKLSIGDEVIAIDGVPISPEFYARRPRPGAETAGTLETLTLSAGRTVEIRLKDYF